jgi:hypothetical protein
MTEQLHVAVFFSPTLGYVSAASHKVPRSLTALSLDGLRRQVVVAFLLRWRKPDQPIAVHLDLDAAAQAELDRRTALRSSSVAQSGVLPIGGR